MPSDITISVLVPAYNEESRLARLLASVHSSFAVLGRKDYELIVCNNNSTDSTATIAQAGGARVVFESHNQIARARNTAASVATGQWLIFIDADSQMTPGLLQETLKRMVTGKYCGGGAVVAMNPAKTPFAMRIGLWLWNCISRVCCWAAGSYIFCLQKAWKEIGGFDEKYYASEEIAFSRGLKRWGRRHNMNFSIITNQTITTSSRKAKQFSTWQMIHQIMLCCLPGSLQRRDRCKFWYERAPKAHKPD
jgi:glycosyltransferase involved in cell wall biosynthesis